MERTAQVEALVLQVLAGDDPAVRLQALNSLRGELDSLEVELAAQAVHAGMSWREIGEALGVSKQAAHRRHSRSVESIEVSEAERPAGSEVGVSVAARRAVRIARQEAARAGVGEVGTEHLLLGLLQCGDNDASELLDGLGVTLAVTRDVVEPTSERTLEAARQAQTRPGPKGTSGISPVAKRTLERALTRASARGAGRLSALDILYCVLAHSEACATRTLERLGVDADGARAQIKELEAVA